MQIKQLLTVAILLLSISCFSQGYHFENYDVSVDLLENGNLHVTENMTVYFSESKRGIIRKIPYMYKWEGKDISVKIKNIKVPNYKFKTSNSRGEKTIRIGDTNKYLDGTIKYLISYEVEGTIAAYEDFIEFYWNVIPDGWDTRIEKYSYTINLPKPLNLAYEDYKVLSGDSGSTDNTSTAIYLDNTLSGRGTAPLSAGQGVSVAIKLPADYVPVSLVSNSSRQNKVPVEPSPWSWLVAVLGLGGLLQFYRKFDKNNVSKYPIVDQHYAPDNMSAAQVGMFYDNVANDRDVMSLLPQWGAEGLIKLEKTNSDTTLTKSGELPEGLPEYEYLLFNGIFADGDIVKLSALKYELAAPLSKAASLLTSEIKKSDLYDADSIKYFHSWRTVLGGFGLIVFSILMMAIFQYIVAGIIGIITGIGLIIISFTRPKMSDIGARIHSKLEGLRAFLNKSDGTAYAKLMEKDPKYFDKIFPYAVAFGLDKSFLSTFNEAVQYEPSWYQYPMMGSTIGTTRPTSGTFADNFDVKEISSVFSAVKPVPSSGRSGGSFGGGGSVGGGFGGGGGSSW